MPNPLEALGISRADLDAVLASDDVKAGKIDLGEKAASYWRSIAPVDEGEYKSSISVQVRGDDVAVVASADHASYLEFGTETVHGGAYRSKTAAKFARED